MARLNVAVADDLNDWLDTRSKEMHISKTALVNLALEQYMQSQILLRKDKGISDFLDEMQKLTKALDKGDIKLVKRDEKDD